MQLGQLYFSIVNPCDFSLCRLVYSTGKNSTEENNTFGKCILKNGDMYHHHKAFVESASQYDTDNRVSRTKKKHLDWLEQLHCRVIKLDSSAELNVLVKVVEEVVFRDL